MVNNKLCVYEAINSTISEAVLGVTNTSDIEELREVHRRMPPVWIGRWDPKDVVAYKIVKAFSSLEAAKEFTEGYRRSKAFASFKVHVTGLDYLRPSS